MRAVEFIATVIMVAMFIIVVGSLFVHHPH
jgi:hypothetical protein